MTKADASEVAAWMAAELERVHSLYQQVAVYDIKARFGAEHVYENENGNLAIAPAVLAEFRKLTADTAVWERGERLWRHRQPSDPSGRQAS